MTTAERLAKVRDRIDAIIDGGRGIKKYASDGSDVERYSLDELRRLEETLVAQIEREDRAVNGTGVLGGFR